jgi:HSP20 family molecular chaperone IbpA
MYVTLGTILVLLVWAFSCLGQKVVVQDNDIQSQFNQMKKRMELREEMHRRMMDKLINGVGADDDLFLGMDQLFNDAFSDSFTNINSMSFGSSRFQSEWIHSKDSKTLVITPQREGQELNIDVKNGAITIKGKSESKSAHGTSVSSFSNSFSVPYGCDESKVNISQEEGKILVNFPCKGTANVDYKKPKEEKRTPLPPTEDAIEI